MTGPAAVPPAQQTAFPYNTWYVAASGDEVQDQLLGRTLLGEEVMIFRDADGTPRALSSRCPHRGYPLTKAPSQRVGTNIQCGYHGLSFDPAGTCIRSPFQNHVPKELRLRSYPVVERRLWIWIWMGDPDKADPALIPELHYPVGKDYNRRVFFSYEAKANYQLLNENLLDFGHAIFLHPGMVDNNHDDSFEYTPPKFTYENDTVVASRLLTGLLPEPKMAKTQGLPEGQLLDRLVEARLTAPGYMCMVDRYTLSDDPTKIVLDQVQEAPTTPTSRNALISWAGVYANRDLSSAELRDTYWDVVQQDVVALEETQKAFELSGENLEEIHLRLDTPALRARRMIAELVGAEQG